MRFAVRRRRSRYLWAVVAGGLLIGALPALFIGLFPVGLDRPGHLFGPGRWRGDRPPPLTIDQPTSGLTDQPTN